jgi:lysyl-tRNA synthetase class 2
MRLLSELVQELLEVGEVERRSYRDAFLRHAGLDPHLASVEHLARAAAQRGVTPMPAPPADSEEKRDAWLDRLLVECVQPHLGDGRPTILYDFPASQAALARIRDDGRPVAERFELFLRGVELANGYYELLDPGELRGRWRKISAQRASDGKYALPGSDRLVSAMTQGLPPCAGVALGFDRLVMLAAGAQTIAEVMPFPVDRA